VIVVDASVLVDLVLVTGSEADRIGSRILQEDELAAPHLVDAEVGQVLRRALLRRVIKGWRAELALERLAALRLTRHEHLRFLPRALELRENLTVYDALYVALAEALQAPLLTRDRAVAEAAGPYGELI